MTPTPREIILMVLDIIEYADNKELFAAEFLKAIEMKAFLDLVASIPEEKRSDFSALLSNPEPDMQELSSLLKQNFTSSEIDTAVMRAGKSIMEGYLEHIMPTLSDQQKSDLERAISSLR
ncbi:MAG: hypothetical protein PHG63_02430 [Candidatus Dojkabacteria bacterium]|nr:hypothetical protein [Candidatus Dojkabacteria bacterium]